ncbi:SNF2 helicase associated [Hymenobacter gelipurpurascens]|uniref:SNF2 helicase associated n=1 Tax=Hymenobacter gelipurpurascens TaxID=89968 RepID=A0A212T338_9BACT|nr:DEAD/DEAH box helicase [Hymenobacter gelipurpurascens]SNC60452.1 SNF2 helicase associated [Hymenobacter gelipurpurascens]
MPRTPDFLPLPEDAPASHQYVFQALAIPDLTSSLIEACCPTLPFVDSRMLAAVQPEALAVDSGTFTGLEPGSSPTTVTVEQLATGLAVSCTCPIPKSVLCEHQALVLLSILDRKELRVFFDPSQRQVLLRTTARDYGLEQAPDLDAHFQLAYHQRSVTVTPKRAELFPITAATKQELVSQLLPAKKPAALPDSSQRLVVFGRHKYYGHLTIQLVEAALTAAGKVKNPVTVLNPLDGIWQLTDAHELKFYTGLGRFQNNYDDTRSAAALEALRAILLNPAGYPFYSHNTAVSEKLTGPALKPLQLRNARTGLRLSVQQKGEFFEVAGQLTLDDQPVELKTVTIRYEYFVVVDEVLYLLEDLDVWRVIEFFKKRNNTLLIHRSKFAEFQQDVLASLEDKVLISYAYIRPATKRQLLASGFDQKPEKLLYLSDAGPHVEVLPVMRYGPKEVPVLSRRQLYALDEAGNAFTLERDVAAEDHFITDLLRHYPTFQEQLQEEALYVPKTLFLQEEWFLAAFEDWQSQGIAILGFNQLKNNTLNPNRARISVQVMGENNWFDTKVTVKFGSQTATLQHIYQAVRNKSRYVRLDDGTRGILPQQWVEKFAHYFEAGEVVEEHIRTPKINFSAVEELYEAEELTPETQAQLAVYQAAAANFTGIAPVEVPPGLHTTLREYQRQGLNWLNFLDTFQFGGCLADDMGLGKTVQVLAFLLHQRAQQRPGANLVVVPTSLVFNWQAEAARFAPSLRVHTLYGTGRQREALNFDDYDLVLTTYNTLVSDIRALKAYRFNYVFLDEAQAIKNPESQRYKAACLLQARNRVAITGTPLENNTFDLYGLLSFACPGLLGSKQHFLGHFATPIDKFKEARRARELQRKINPFVLRRTKAQVAAELPDKTEMVLYCEMGTEQRRVYQACKAEYRDMLLGQLPNAKRRHNLHILQGLTKLRQICDSPALLRNEEFYGQESAKLEVLLEEISSKAPQHKILVFSQFVSMLELIRQELDTRGLDYAYLTGQTKNRAAQVGRFQEDDNVRVFLISLKAGGTGLNLTQADYVYLVDPWWNPAVENQAIDRSHRLGQTKKVVAVRLICPDTIEDKIRKMQEQKQELAYELIKTDAALLKALTPQELLDLFS